MKKLISIFAGAFDLTCTSAQAQYLGCRLHTRGANDRIGRTHDDHGDDQLLRSRIGFSLNQTLESRC